MAVSGIVKSADMSADGVTTAADDGARMTGEVVDAIIDVANRSRGIAEQSNALMSQAESGTATISGAQEQFDDLRSQIGSPQTRFETLDCEVSADN